VDVVQAVANAISKRSLERDRLTLEMEQIQAEHKELGSCKKKV
jgi:hypothetical protein